MFERWEMKTIMIVDDDPATYSNMQQYVRDENIDFIHVTNSRHGVTTLADNPNVQLVLVNTKCPETDIPAYFSLKPGENLKIGSDDPANYLKKPFSKDALLHFIEQKMQQ